MESLPKPNHCYRKHETADREILAGGDRSETEAGRAGRDRRRQADRDTKT